MKYDEERERRLKYARIRGLILGFAVILLVILWAMSI